MNNLKEKLNEKIKTRKFWGGATLVIFGVAGLGGIDPWMAVSILAIIWGGMGIFWPHNWKQKVQDHHHHHHHNRQPQKKTKRNYSKKHKD